jgi:hypothetical protein
LLKDHSEVNQGFFAATGQGAQLAPDYAQLAGLSTLFERKLVEHGQRAPLVSGQQQGLRSRCGSLWSERAARKAKIVGPQQLQSELGIPTLPESRQRLPQQGGLFGDRCGARSWGQGWGRLQRCRTERTHWQRLRECDLGL